MGDAIQAGIGKDNRILLGKVAYLRGDRRVHYQRTDFFRYWHTLILLYVTGRDGVYEYFKSNVLNTWLEARSVDIWNLDEFIGASVCRDVIPRAMKWDRHSCHFSIFKSRAGYHHIGVNIVILVITVHKSKIECRFIESTRARNSRSKVIILPLSVGICHNFFILYAILLG